MWWGRHYLIAGHIGPVYGSFVHVWSGFRAKLGHCDRSWMTNWTKVYGIQIMAWNPYLQWGLEHRTRLDFEWSKVVLMLNGSDFKWHSKTDQPDYSKFDQIARILDSYWFHFQMVVAIALALVPIILIPDHPKSKHEQVWIWNSSEFKNLVFGEPTVHLKMLPLYT